MDNEVKIMETIFDYVREQLIIEDAAWKFQLAAAKSNVAGLCKGEMPCFKEMKTKELINRIKDFILDN